MKADEAMIIVGLTLATLALAAVEIFVRSKKVRWMGPLAGGLIGMAVGAWAGPNDHFIATRVLPIWALLIYFMYGLKLLDPISRWARPPGRSPCIPSHRVEAYARSHDPANLLAIQRTPTGSLNVSKVRWIVRGGTRGSFLEETGKC